MRWLDNFFRRKSGAEAPAPLERTCPQCGITLANSPFHSLWRVCPSCRHHSPLAAWERISLLADPGSFRETGAYIGSVDPLGFADRLPYRQRLQEARKKTGLQDAIVTGTATLEGHPLILAAMDFAFLGGSMGSAVGEKLAQAFELALKKKLPVVAVANSGGARIQEGGYSLAQMAKTAAVAQRLHPAGVPLISILADPTTGGPLASFASLSDILIAEPRALIGFSGPRVAEAVLGSSLPPGSHTSEFLLAHGMVDLVVDREQHREKLASILSLAKPSHRVSEPLVSHAEPATKPDISAWERVQMARDPNRPTSMDHIASLVSCFVELKGDRLFGDDPAIVGGLGQICGVPAVIIAQERGHADTRAHRRDGRARPEGYRKAIRLMDLAAKLHLPVICLVDTPGAYPGAESEERGLASALAHCVARLSELPTPVISVVIGEGGSGGAMALSLADRVLMLENAIFPLIAPEGAAAILYHDPAQAEMMTHALRVTAADCLALGTVDNIVPEPAGGAHRDPAVASALLGQALAPELRELLRVPIPELVQRRYLKYRALGEYRSGRLANLSWEIGNARLRLRGWARARRGQNR